MMPVGRSSALPAKQRIPPRPTRSGSRKLSQRPRGASARSRTISRLVREVRLAGPAIALASALAHFRKVLPAWLSQVETRWASVAGNPFALGAIAALVGIVAGALLPVSEQEEAALGSTATKLRTAGRDLAQDVVDRGGRVATDTLEAIKGSANAHGLTTDKPIGELLADVKSGDLLGNVKQVAQETLQAGKDSAQTHIAGEAKSRLRRQFA